MDFIKKFINTQLIANPINWVIVFLMLALVAIAIPLILPSKENGAS